MKESVALRAGPEESLLAVLLLCPATPSTVLNGSIMCIALLLVQEHGTNMYAIHASALNIVHMYAPQVRRVIYPRGEQAARQESESGERIILNIFTLRST